MSIAITPDTKVGDLLTAYPGLEPVLIQYAPAFKALQNPILRRTVARMASLAHAAQVGGVPVRDLVAALRAAAGIPESPEVGLDAPPEESRPHWAEDCHVKLTIDVDRLLALGEVPLAHAQRAVQALAEGDLLLLRSSFRPAPLTDALQQGGHSIWCTASAPTPFLTYVRRKSLAR